MPALYNKVLFKYFCINTESDVSSPLKTTGKRVTIATELICFLEVARKQMKTEDCIYIHQVSRNTTAI